MEEGDEPPDFEAEVVEVDGVQLHLDPVYLDRDPDNAVAQHTALPPRLESWRRRSATGAILTGIGLGLKKALEPEREEPSIVMIASGEPPTDLPVDADMGGLLPSDKVVRIRPWLLAADTAGAAPEPTPVPMAPSARATPTGALAAGTPLEPLASPAGAAPAANATPTAPPTGATPSGAVAAGAPPEPVGTPAPNETPQPAAASPWTPPADAVTSGPPAEQLPGASPAGATPAVGDVSGGPA